jgi:hypothetical protein
MRHRGGGAGRLRLLQLLPPTDHGVLEQVEAALGDREQARVAVAFLAGADVTIPDDELRGARRRAVLLLAAGGDPHRDLDLEGRAVQALASDLDSKRRREALATGLSAVAGAAPDLEVLHSTVDELLADTDLAWRSFACSLLVEELAGETA